MAYLAIIGAILAVIIVFYLLVFLIGVPKYLARIASALEAIERKTK